MAICCAFFVVVVVKVFYPVALLGVARRGRAPGKKKFNVLTFETL